MRFVLFLIGVFLLPLCVAPAAHAKVQLSSAWAPPSLKGISTGVAYLTLTSDAGDVLLSASSPVAAVVEIHTHIKHEGVLRMRKLSSLAVDGGKTISFEPRGLHFMLYQLKSPLTEGQTFPLTLRFKNAGEVTVTATVNQQKLLDYLK